MGKDNKLEIVIDGLLCYVSTARHSLSKDSIVQSCCSFYDLNKVKESKDLLCVYSGDKPVRRRGDNARKTEMQDIYDTFIKCDENDIVLPRFTADSFDTMPPTAGYELIGTTIVTLINEISSLRDELKSIKDVNKRNDIILDDFNHMKSDVLDIKQNLRDIKLRFMEREIRKIDEDNVSMATALHHHTPSAPTLSQIEKNDTIFSNSYLNHTYDDKRSSLPMIVSNSPLKLSNEFLEPNKSVIGEQTSIDYSRMKYSEAAKSFIRDSIKTNSSSINSRDSVTVIPKQALSDGLKTRPAVDAEGFTTVRRKRQRIVGTNTKSAKSIKSAARYYDLYIGNCDPSLTCDELKRYIFDETSISVISVEELNTSIPFSKSFKISATFDERDKLLTPDVWPVGIICRKFFKPLNRKLNNK